MYDKIKYNENYNKECYGSILIQYRKDSEISNTLQDITVYCKTQGLSRNQFILNAIIKEWERIDKG